MPKTCSICNTPYAGLGHSPRPLLGPEARCCDACNSTVVLPLRVARLIACEGAQRVAEFALMLARQRTKLPPAPVGQLKDMALLAATGLVANAVEAAAIDWQHAAERRQDAQ